MYLWQGFISQQNWVTAASLWNGSAIDVELIHFSSDAFTWFLVNWAASRCDGNVKRLFFWEQTITEVNLAMNEFRSVLTAFLKTLRRSADYILLRNRMDLIQCWYAGQSLSGLKPFCDLTRRVLLTLTHNKTTTHCYLCAWCQRWQPPAAEPTCFSKVSHLRPCCCSTKCNMVPASQRCDLLKQSSVETAPEARHPAAGGLRGRGRRLIGCRLLFEDKHLM